jgi:Putative peptidoglycan binding domain
MPYTVVTQGENVLTLALRAGLSWRAVWDHPNNADLRARRSDPNVLAPGDALFLPELREAEFACATNARHRFKLKGIPARFQLQLMERGRPRSGEPFVLDVDGERITGVTTADGVVDVNVPPHARQAVLTVGRDARRRGYTVALNHLDPVDTVAGAQGRLANLGFASADPRGQFGDDTREALRSFQARAGLPVTGELDAATRAQLAKAHDR